MKIRAKPCHAKRPGPRGHRESVFTRARLAFPVPDFLPDRCMDCGGCVGVCPHDSLDLFQGFITVRASCTECDLCVRLCPVDAFRSVNEKAPRATLL